MGRYLAKVIEKSDKYIPLLLKVVIIIFCMCTFIPVGSVRRYFHGECVLYAKPSMKAVTMPNNQTTLKVDVRSSEWGGQSTCYYAIYSPVVASIFTFISLWFLVQFKLSMNEERPEGHEFAEILIGGIFNIVLIIVLFVNSCVLSAGTSTLCNNIERSLRDRFECEETQDMIWSIYIDTEKHPFYKYLQLGQASSWITVLVLFVQILYTIKKGVQLLPYSDCSDEEEMSDSDEDIVGSYKVHKLCVETGSVRFHQKSRKQSKRSDEIFLL